MGKLDSTSVFATNIANGDVNVCYHVMLCNSNNKNNLQSRALQPAVAVCLLLVGWCS